MSERVRVHSPEPKHAAGKEFIRVTREPIRLSEQTIEEAERVMRDLEHGEARPDMLNPLIDSVESDLKTEGIDLTKGERTMWKEKVRSATQSEPAAHTTPESDRTFEVSLPEYQKMFSELSKVYGLDRQKLKLGAVEGLIMQSKAIDALASISFGSIFLPLIQGKIKLPRTGELAGRWMGSAFVPGASENHPDMGVIPLRVREEHGIAALRELFGEAKRFKWPVAILLAYIPSSIAGFAGKMKLVDAMKTVRTAINDRAANSLLRRDLEFVHDKSAAEINNILEKGKQSTLDFFETTYGEVLPRLGTIGLATLGQIPMNPIGATLQLARLPFLYGMSTSYAREVLKQRASDLKRKDMIDTRINATLGSLEIVKTSDSMDTAIDELKDQMTKRDAFQMTSSKEALKQEVKMETANSLFGWGIPIVASGINYLRTGHWKDAATTGIVSRVGSNIVERNAKELVALYTEKIQPALQDIKRMEELLGPYDKLDMPDGPMERERVAASGLTDFDISVRDLSYKDILHSVSLDIPQGSFVTLKGPSGSGKTTLMRHMLGLFGAGEGTVSYGGVDLKKIKKFGDESIYRHIGYANQNPQYFENMTLKENLLLWTKRDIPDEEIVKVLHDLRLDQIVPRMDSTVKHFSGGEMRRIGIARALLKDPKVLFLDEPTANLDDESTKQVIQIIRDMRKSRPDMTVVAVTHDPQFEAIAERVVDFAGMNTRREPQNAPLNDDQVYFASAKGE